MVYGFHFNHEVTTCFEADYDAIYDKYIRRIEKFREMIKQKTCFIRAIRNNEELRYIQDNLHVIEEIIQKSNSGNENIYVVSSRAVTCEDLEFPFFVIDCIYDESSRKGLRSLFDKNVELQQFIIKNYSEDIRYRNLYFDLQAENKRLKPMASEYELLMHIDKINVAQQTAFLEIIIYGAGIVGKYLYQKIKSNCKVRCFVDQHAREKAYEGVPIIRYDDFIEQIHRDIPIVVTVYSYNDVQIMLSEAGKQNIISIDAFICEIERYLLVLR